MCLKYTGLSRPDQSRDTEVGGWSVRAISSIANLTFDSLGVGRIDSQERHMAVGSLVPKVSGCAIGREQQGPGVRAGLGQ